LTQHATDSNKRKAKEKEKKIERHYNLQIANQISN